MKVKAFGKINLTLDVLGRRRDGYHLLDTVMQTVSIWDELEIQTGGERGVRLECNRESLPLDSRTQSTGRRSSSWRTRALSTRD